MKTFKKTVALLLVMATLFCTGALSASGDSVSARTLNETKQKIFYVLYKAGYNSAAISGILANIEAESDFDPNNYGDHGTSYGLCQWRLERLEALKKRSNYTSVEVQAQFIADELEGKTGYSYYTSVGTYLKNVDNTAQGAYDAGYKFCYSYEVPSDRENKSVTRGNNAKNKYWPDWKSPDEISVKTNKTSYSAGEAITITVTSDIAGSSYAVGVYEGEERLVLLTPEQGNNGVFTIKINSGGNYRLYASATYGLGKCYAVTPYINFTVKGENGEEKPIEPTTKPTTKPNTTKPTETPDEPTSEDKVMSFGEKLANVLSLIWQFIIKSIRYIFGG